MFHPSAPVTVIGFLLFVAAAIVAAGIANRSYATASCLACGFLGSLATLALIASLPDVIVPIRDPASGGELIVRGHFLDRWLMPEMALSDREELFFPRVAVVHDQPRAADPKEKERVVRAAKKPPAP